MTEETFSKKTRQTTIFGTYETGLQTLACLEFLDLELKGLTDEYKI